jgi:predicted amidophosphoribosyltransferase
MSNAVEGTHDTRFKVPEGIRVQLTCPRCWGPMVRHNGNGRRPKCCEKCRTPAEKNRVEYLRKKNEERRQAKAKAKMNAEIAAATPTTFGEMR